MSKIPASQDVSDQNWRDLIKRFDTPEEARAYWRQASIEERWQQMTLLRWEAFGRDECSKPIKRIMTIVNHPDDPDDAGIVIYPANSDP